MASKGVKGSEVPYFLFSPTWTAASVKRVLLVWTAPSAIKTTRAQATSDYIWPSVHSFLGISDSWKCIRNKNFKS